jgi:hypothetical protein
VRIPLHQVLGVHLPQGEVTRVALLLAHLDPGPRLQLLQHLARQLAVLGEGLDREVDLAGAVGVGVVAVQQLLDQRQHLGDVAGGARVQPGIARLGAAVVAQPQGPGVGLEGGQEVLRHLVGVPAQLAGRLGQLVLPVGVGQVVLGHVAHVGDVHDVADPQPGALQHAAEQVGHQKRPEIPDVRERVDGGPAAVEAHGAIAG